MMIAGPDPQGIDPKGLVRVVAAGPAAELENLSAAVDDSIGQTVEVGAADQPHGLSSNAIEQYDRVQKIGVVANLPHWIRRPGFH